MISAASDLQLLSIAGSEPALLQGLAAAGLPTNDLAEDGRNFFRVLRDNATVGFGGYECHGDAVLLRSIVIDPACRDQGLGRAVTQALMQRARASGMRQAYLLTSSAATFFEALGFTRIDRALAPAAIRETRQATMLCPASAALLTKSLHG